MPRNPLMGRKKGTPNKTTSEVRGCFQKLVENNLIGLQDDLDHLQPFERIKMILELAKFFLPQIKSVELQVDQPPMNNIISLGRGVSPERAEEIMREEIQRISDQLETEY